MKSQHIISEKLSIVLFSAMFLFALPLVAAAQEKIFFTSARDGNNEIYAMNPDGSDPVRLTDNPADDRDPVISPDGLKVAFASARDGNFEIYLMNANGTNPVRLTNNAAIDFSPAFSPDGAKIVFLSERDGGNREIYSMNSDGSNQTNLTNNLLVDDFYPSFSPDGTRIVFYSDRDLTTEIYVMNADGSNQTRLTDSDQFYAQPTFSPDGSKIAFVRYLQNLTFNPEIYVMNADGTNQIRLTNIAGDDTEPVFSPDGSKIAFTSVRDGNQEIYTMNADGTNQTRITANAVPDSQPSWGVVPQIAPNLNNIAVSSPVIENGSATLSGKIVELNSGDAFVLTVNWGDGSAPQIFNYPAGTSSFSETHQYSDDNPTATASDNYTISLTLSDTNGGSDSGSASVTVNNAAPTLSGISLNPSTVFAGSPISVSGTVNDVGAQDSHAIVINWGDGSPNTTLALAPSGLTAFSATHTYANSGSYNISITASDDDTGSITNVVGVTVNSPPVAPNAPSNLRIDSVGLNRITIMWTDNSGNEDGFAIEQCANKNCNNAAQIGQVGANVTTFTHTGLFANTQYTYRVRAFNSTGNSAYSNTASAKTLRR
jgi:Tol biopolymer transport system component